MKCPVAGPPPVSKLNEARGATLDSFPMAALPTADPFSADL